MARDADFMLTPEERQLRARKRRRWWLIVLGLIASLGIAAIAARPTRDAIKSWQARRQAEKAFALIEQEKWKEAQQAAIAAYQLRATEPEALRAVARFLSRVRQPQAFEFWDKLKERQALTHEDLRDQAALALGTGERLRAAAAVNALTSSRDAAPADWVLAAQLQLQQGASDKAMESAEKVFAHGKSPPREQLQATVLQLQATGATNAAEDSTAQRGAWKRLDELANRDDAVGLESLIILAQRQLASANAVTPANADASGSEIPPPGNRDPITDGQFDRAALSRRLEAHPLARAPQKLLALDLQILAHPAQRQELIHRAIEEWKKADAPPLGPLAAWLNSKGEFQLQLDTIPLETALQSQDLFLQHVDALGALGRWDEIRKLLEAERFPLDPMIQQMYLARCNAQLGNEAATQNSWQRALDAAGNDVAKLTVLGEYAEKNGAAKIAESAYRAATHVAPKIRQAWLGRLRLARLKRDTRHLHELTGVMLQIWPADTAIRNDGAYMRLLLLNDSGASSDIAEIEREAASLVEAEPSSLAHRTLLALARLKQGRVDAALEAYKHNGVALNIRFPLSVASASALAVHAAVSAAAGHSDAARQDVELLREADLLPEERALISRLVQTSDAASDARPAR